eukprot:TRINITY_DN28732_c0_g1_i1.p1 TRINITY_DN28732_c0_g1~~TRINITY_DN28732_c0_g1_i1.p1  ORF type:complete len:1281 (+),score=419.84 TRINITY_DN28732_c0_g1_i1:52-3843(+)
MPSPIHTRRYDDPLPLVSVRRPPFPVSRTRTQGHHVLLGELPGPLLPRPGRAELRHFAGSDDDGPIQQDEPPACVEQMQEEWRESEKRKAQGAEAEVARNAAKAQAEVRFVDWLTTREAEAEAAASHGPPSHSVRGENASVRAARLCAEALTVVADSDTTFWRPPPRGSMPHTGGRSSSLPFRPPPISTGTGGHVLPQPPQQLGRPSTASTPPASVTEKPLEVVSAGAGTQWPAPGAELSLSVACACLDRVAASAGPFAPLLALIRDCIVPRLYAQGARSLCGDWGGLAARVKHYLGQTPYFASDTALRWECSVLANELHRAKDHMRVWAWSIWRNVLRGTRRQALFLQRVEIMVSSRTRKLFLRGALVKWMAFTDVRRATRELRRVNEALGLMVPEGTTMLDRLNKITEELKKRDESLKAAERQLARTAAKQEKLRADLRRCEARAQKHENAAEESLRRHCETCAELHSVRLESERLREQVKQLERGLDHRQRVCDNWCKAAKAMLVHVNGEGVGHDPHLQRRLRASRRGRRRRRSTASDADESSSDDSVASSPLDLSDTSERHGNILRDWGNRVLETQARTETWRPEGEATRPALSTFTLETRDCILYARLLHAFSVVPGQAAAIPHSPHPPSPTPSSPRTGRPQYGVTVSSSRGFAAARDAVARGGPAPRSCGAIFGDLPTMTYVARAAVILDYATRLIGYRPPVAPADIADGVRPANLIFLSSLYLACSTPRNHATEAQLVRRVPRMAPPVEELPQDYESAERVLSTPQDMLGAFWRAADRRRSWRAHLRLIECSLLDTVQNSGGSRGSAQPQVQAAAQQLKCTPARLRAILLRRSGDSGEDDSVEADAERAAPVFAVVEQHSQTILRVFRHYASGCGANGVQTLTLQDWLVFCTDCGCIPRILSSDDAERVFLISNEAAGENVQEKQLNVDHNLVVREFVEALVRVADMIDRDGQPQLPQQLQQSQQQRPVGLGLTLGTQGGLTGLSRANSFVTTVPGQAADQTLDSLPEGMSLGDLNTGVPAAAYSPLAGLQMSLPALLSMLIVKYIIPNAAQSELDTLKKQIAGDDVQRVLRRYEAPLKAVFFYFVKGHIETGATLDLQDYQRCIKDCNFISAEFTHQSVATIFVSCTNSGGRDDGRMGLHTFFDTLAYVALYKQPSPFTPLFKRLDYFLARQFFPALRPKVSTLAHHMKLLNAAAVDGVRALSQAQTQGKKLAALNRTHNAGTASVVSGATTTARSPLSRGLTSLSRSESIRSAR